ncbi:MAG: glycosyltransferase family 4 protein [Alcaligenaceae bacterium]
MSDARSLRIIHSEAATSFGGQEHRVFKEMVAMRERGHHLEAICQPDAELTERLREAGFVVHTLYMDGTVNIVRGIFRLKKILQAGRFDVLNTHSRQDTLIAAAAARLAKVPLVVRTRHLASPVGSLLTYTWLPHRVTTVSHHVRRQFLARGVPPDQVQAIYTPVVLTPRLAHSTLRDELKLSADAILVGCIAVLRPNKGHLELINAMLPLLRTRPALHLVMAGGGSPVFEQLQAHITHAGLVERIHLLGTRRDVPNVLAGLDIFCLATRQEAMGTAFLEAAASGLPVIGTDVGGVGELMRPGETGLLVPLDDGQALQNALIQLIDSPELRNKMGQAGYERIHTEGVFTTETLAKRTERIYDQWLEDLHPSRQGAGVISHQTTDRH